MEDGRHFFDHSWPEARAVADPDCVFYEAFGIQRGGMKELFSPGVLVCGLRAGRKGHRMGAPAGDTRMMPGLFLAAGDQILWRHEYKHAGDHPDFAALARLPAAAKREM